MRQMASPNPVPCAFVETNALNTLSNCLESIPGPESCTETTISSRPRTSVLTRNVREREIMIQVARGRLSKQIAGDIGIAEATVKVHRSRAMRKMNARSLPELGRMADKLKLVPEKPQRS